MYVHALLPRPRSPTWLCAGVLLDWDTQGTVLGPAINLAVEDATLRWFPEAEGEHLNWLWHDE
jgi:hypothetical protein